MDARAFADFLLEDITKNLKAIEAQLVEGSFTSIEATQRAAGQRQVFHAFATQMDALLKAFYEAKEKSNA